MSCFNSAKELKPLVKKIKEIHRRFNEQVKTATIYEVLARMFGHRSWNHYSALLQKGKSDFEIDYDDYGMAIFPLFDLVVDIDKVRSFYGEFNLVISIESAKLILCYINDLGHELFPLKLWRLHFSEEVKDFPNVERELSDEDMQESCECFHSGSRILTSLQSPFSELVRITFYSDGDTGNLIIYSCLQLRERVGDPWVNVLGVYSCHLEYDYGGKNLFHVAIDMEEIAPYHNSLGDCYSEEVRKQSSSGLRIIAKMRERELEYSMFAILDPYTNLSENIQKMFDQLFPVFINQYVWGNEIDNKGNVLLTLPFRSEGLAEKYKFDRFQIAKEGCFYLSLNESAHNDVDIYEHPFSME